MIDKVNLKGTLHEIHDSRLIVKDDLPFVGKFPTVSDSTNSSALVAQGVAYWLEDLSNRWWSLTPQERENYRNPVFLKGKNTPVFDGTLTDSSSAMLMIYVSSDEENQSTTPQFQGYAYTSVGMIKFWYSSNTAQREVDGEEWQGGIVTTLDEQDFYCEVGKLSGDPDHVYTS